MRWFVWLMVPLTYALGICMVAVLRAFAFRHLTPRMLGFLVSRPILSGCGTLERDGTFFLSEKARNIKRLMWFAVSAKTRGVFDVGNLVKVLDLTTGRVFRYARLFRRRQRLQLGASDSNVLDTAEYLKVGATVLALDMAEAGFLEDAPRPVDPIASLHELSADPTLAARTALRGGERWTALSLQRYYCRKAREFVMQSPSSSLEALEIVDLWESVLDRLENVAATDAGRGSRARGAAANGCIGELDWVTKRFLIEECGDREPFEVRKKIDLRYHELGRGYAARLVHEGKVDTLFTHDEIERAVQDPPDDTPAFARGRLVTQQRAASMSVGWDAVRVGGRLRGKIIRLDDYREPRS